MQSAQARIDSVVALDPQSCEDPRAVLRWLKVQRAELDRAENMPCCAAESLWRTNMISVLEHKIKDFRKATGNARVRCCFPSFRTAAKH